MSSMIWMTFLDYLRKMGSDRVQRSSDHSNVSTVHQWIEAEGNNDGRNAIVPSFLDDKENDE